MVSASSSVGKFWAYLSVTSAVTGPKPTRSLPEPQPPIPPAEPDRGLSSTHLLPPGGGTSPVLAPSVRGASATLPTRGAAL